MSVLPRPAVIAVVGAWPRRAIFEHVTYKRPPFDADRLRIAKLYGTAVRHAKWRPLTDDETAAGAAELRALAAGRADLHAETAGILTGASEGTLMAPLKHCAAGLLSEASAIIC